METSKYEKKRGRIRKKIEAMRMNGTLLDAQSPCSSLSEGLDLFPGGGSLSQQQSEHDQVYFTTFTNLSPTKTNKYL